MKPAPSHQAAFFCPERSIPRETFRDNAQPVALHITCPQAFALCHQLSRDTPPACTVLSFSWRPMHNLSNTAISRATFASRVTRPR